MPVLGALIQALLLAVSIERAVTSNSVNWLCYVQYVTKCEGALRLINAGFRV